MLLSLPMNTFFPLDFNASRLPSSALLTQTIFNFSFFQIPFTEKKINRILWIKKLILAMGSNTKEGDQAPPLAPRPPGTVHAQPLRAGRVKHRERLAGVCRGN